MARTVQSFVADLPERAVRLAVHVGEQRAPSLVGDVDIAALRGEDGRLDVARVVAAVEGIADDAGYPRTAPSLAVKAYADGDTRRPVATFQRTADGWEGATGHAPGGKLDTRDLMLMKLTDSVLDAARILRDNAADLSRALVDQRRATNEAEERLASERADRADLEVANAQLESAVEMNEAAAEAEVKVKALDTFEKVAMNAGFSPEKLKARMKKDPAAAKALLASLMGDPEVVALLNS